MWKFSNFNSGNSLWPPDAGQQQNSVNPYGCSLSVNPNCPLPDFGTQESFFPFNSSLYPSLNPVIGSSEQEAITQTKRFLIFDHSRDQTSLVFSSVASPFEGFNLPLPASNTTYADASNCHAIEEEEMQEDSEEIDALLYSDSECMEDEETSTGHSPFDIAEEDITSSHFPAKRRRVDSSELDASLIDTASSAIAPHSHCTLEEDDFGPSSAPKGTFRSKRDKQERIQRTVSVLRRIIPGGKGKNTAAVLDEAIQYLKSLKLRAKSFGTSSSSL
ncbi:transcription factor bHLH145 [Dendrobium catenatum]|nr:transcription factor bHLH145 [Dendrobium catenatum]XP_028555435.1 transcription factor bHLH145 [Dendrobium catenatum]